MLPEVAVRDLICSSAINPDGTTNASPSGQACLASSSKCTNGSEKQEQIQRY